MRTWFIDSIRLLKNSVLGTVVFLIYCCLAILFVCADIGHIDILFGLERLESFSDINIRFLAGWTVIIFLPHIVNGFLVGRSEVNVVFCCMRLKSYGKYRRRIYGACLINSFIWGIILWVAHSFVSRLYMIELLLVLASHILMWTSVMIFFLSLTNRSIFSFILPPVICIITIGLSYCNIPVANLMISNYGMLARSGLYEKGEASPIVQMIINIIVSALCIGGASCHDSINKGELIWRLS